jgi:hypothetical protein
MAGYRLVEDPQAQVEHGSKPRSTGCFIQIRNRWHFMLKNYETHTLVLLLPALAIHEPLQFALLVVKGTPARASSYSQLRRGCGRSVRSDARSAHAASCGITICSTPRRSSFVKTSSADAWAAFRRA